MLRTTQSQSDTRKNTCKNIALSSHLKVVEYFTHIMMNTYNPPICPKRQLTDIRMKRTQMDHNDVEDHIANPN